MSNGEGLILARTRRSIPVSWNLVSQVLRGSLS